MDKNLDGRVNPKEVMSFFDKLDTNKSGNPDEKEVDRALNSPLLEFATQTAKFWKNKSCRDTQSPERPGSARCR